IRTITSCLLLLFMLSANAANTPMQTSDDPSLTVTISDGGTALMSWTSFGTSGQYTVTVTDLTTNRQVTQFGTASTGATVTGLTGGHTIRFAVSRNNLEIVIEDIHPN
ncbi:MAG TPA: hypothetical protein VK168_03320, partial [Saprospiraceae bacterium]|nr:hypothetical protein [Saprospiraceae bacterium]